MVISNCPFCGGISSFIKDGCNHGYIMCNDCNCRTKTCYDDIDKSWQKKCVDIWNLRR